MKIKEYVVAKDVEQAYELLQKNRMNRIIGGMLWLKMQDIMIPCAIDLSACGLDQIEENDEEIILGAMVSLRDLETSVLTKDLYQGFLKESVQDIVGVQFRNMATLGGSLYSRFGFSDLLCALLVLDCDVVTYKHGRMPLKEFVDLKYERDVLTHVILSKSKGKACIKSVRNSATDFPTLVVSVAYIHNCWRIAIGARPKKAQLLLQLEKYDEKLDEEAIQEIVQMIDEQIEFHSNMRASLEYRQMIAKALVKKAINKIMEEESC